MKKTLQEALRASRAVRKKEEQEYGGPLGYDSEHKRYINSRNPPDVMAKFHSCYDGSGRDLNQVAKDAVELTGRFLSGCKQHLQLGMEDRQHLKIREGITEFRDNYKKLDVSLYKSEAKLGMLENNIFKENRIVPSELQTVMAGVTRRFARSEATGMYQSIFHYGPLEPEEDFNQVRSQNDVVIALSYRHQGENRMSESTFLHVLDNIFHAVHVMKPEVTHIRLWVDAVASRRARGRRWVSKGVLPYTVFPVCVCDQRFSLRWNRTWINIETILGLMGAGLMVFDQRMVQDMELVHRTNETWQAGDFYFRGGQADSIRNLKYLAAIALRGVFDDCKITWQSDYDDILQLLSRAAICDSAGTLLRLLSPDESVVMPTNFHARSLIATLLGYENQSRDHIPFMEARALNTHIEYIWGHNTPYPPSWECHKLLLAVKHLGCIDHSVIECAESMLQKDQPIWLVLAFETYQVAVEFHREWTERKHVRLVHVLINGNARPFEGQIVTTFISCWSGESDVNYQHMSIRRIEYISNAINVMKVITELRRIGAVEEQSVLQKFWFVKNEDVAWTMGPAP